MNINWRVRFKNPVFAIQLLAAVAGPILIYYGLSYEDFTTWGAVWSTTVDAVKNPYVVGMIAFAVWNAVNDPTVKGLQDSRKVMTYDEPKDPRGL